jgi:hypothetical protein
VGASLIGGTHMRLRTKTTAIVGGAILAVIAPATAAHAGAITIDDETSDVWEILYDEETQDETLVEAGSVDNVDVDSTRVRHLTNRIVLTTTYTDLTKQDIILGAIGDLRFDDAPAVGFYLDTYQDWSGETVLFKSRNGAPIDCGGFDHAIDYAANTVEFSIPRKCVGSPRWVEARYVGTANQEDEEVGYRNWRDNALTSGSGTGGWSERVRRG